MKAVIIYYMIFIPAAGLIAVLSDLWSSLKVMQYDFKRLISINYANKSL